MIAAALLTLTTSMELAGAKRTLADEMRRLAVRSALVLASQAVDKHPRLVA